MYNKYFKTKSFLIKHPLSDFVKICCKKRISFFAKLKRSDVPNVNVNAARVRKLRKANSLGQFHSQK